MHLRLFYAIKLTYLLTYLQTDGRITTL